MAPPTNEEARNLGSPRATLITLAILLIIPVTGLMVLYGIGSRPFKTMQKFINHVQCEQFDAAKAMIDPADLESIPEEYWEQFRGRPPVDFSSPTPWVFLNGRLSMKVKHVEPVEDWREKIDIRFEVYGNRIRVREIRGI
jgi:hypothetical protein